eukprot:TRINITY_DN5451_c0_g1_i2.p1 TRINITY_DN5451_c0_g1~~TRINITY_DN5451_c0_g1_i2.p1  ORF type:complete len:302 (-),score=32.10 TRINITY_DN5451_c0_g1_i2:61-909(-)
MCIRDRFKVSAKVFAYFSAPGQALIIYQTDLTLLQSVTLSNLTILRTVLGFQKISSQEGIFAQPFIGHDDYLKLHYKNDNNFKIEERTRPPLVDKAINPDFAYRSFSSFKFPCELVYDAKEQIYWRYNSERTKKTLLHSADTRNSLLLHLRSKGFALDQLQTYMSYQSISREVLVINETTRKRVKHLVLSEQINVFGVFCVSSSVIAEIVNNGRVQSEFRAINLYSGAVVHKIMLKPEMRRGMFKQGGEGRCYVKISSAECKDYLLMFDEHGFTLLLSLIHI